MFEAFILVCAVNINQEIDTNMCIDLADYWGPYKTEENCNIRTNQMASEAFSGELNPIVSFMLGNPPFLYVEEYCTIKDAIKYISENS